MVEFEKPSPKLLIVAGVFLGSVLAFSLLLGSLVTTITLTKEGLLGCLPVLVCFFLVGSLAIIFSLISERKIGILGLFLTAVLFGSLLLALPTLWRLGISLALFLGFLVLRSQARRTHEIYTGFSASYFRGVMRTFFFFFVFILAMTLFLLSRQALGRNRTLIPRETLEPAVSQIVTIFGGLMSQEFGGEVSEDLLAPVVEDALLQMLRQVGLEAQLEGQPTSLAEVTARISGVLEEGLAEMATPFKPYVPFVLAGMALFILTGLSPIIVPLGALVFFVVYKLLLLIRLLKLEESERIVKRLTLA